MYVGISKLVKKVPKRKVKEHKNPNEPGEESKDEDSFFDIDPNDDILIGEENGENVYISKKALKEKIHNSQVLSALLYESQRCLKGEE
jgi:hypothetical protein